MLAFAVIGGTVIVFAVSANPIHVRMIAHRNPRAVD
jgi:hypothetical protein